jgi:hypothetical protein
MHGKAVQPTRAVMLVELWRINKVAARAVKHAANPFSCVFLFSNAESGMVTDLRVFILMMFSCLA